MPDDRPLPPSAARVRRAYAAGIRPSVGPVVAALGFAAVVASGAARLPASIASVGRIGSSSALADLLGTMVGVAGTVALVVLAGLAALGVRPVDRAARARFSGVRVRRSSLAMAGGVALGTALAAAVGAPLAAACARAAAASPAGIAAFFEGWGVRGAVGVGLGLAALSAYARFVERRAIVQALYQSHAQRRAEQRPGR